MRETPVEVWFGDSVSRKTSSDKKLYQVVTILESSTTSSHKFMSFLSSFRLVFVAVILASSCSATSRTSAISGSLDALYPTTTTTTTTTTTIPDAVVIEVEPPPVTLETLIDTYFEPEDKEWALRVAKCESSARPDDKTSDAYNEESGASGWFQHLPKFWEERTKAAGIPGADIFDPVAQVLIAAYLLYETPSAESHWYPSEHCWSKG